MARDRHGKDGGGEPSTPEAEAPPPEAEERLRIALLRRKQQRIHARRAQKQHHHHGADAGRSHPADPDGLLEPSFDADDDNKLLTPNFDAGGKNDKQLLTPNFDAGGSDQQLLEPNFDDAPASHGGAAQKPKAGHIDKPLPSKYSRDALVEAMHARDGHRAILIAGMDAGRAVKDLQASKEPAEDDVAFFAHVRQSKPYPAPECEALHKVYRALPYTDKKLLFAAQFDVTVEAAGKVGREEHLDFSEAELNIVYEAAIKLPTWHVTDNPAFTELVNKKKGAPTHSALSVDMSEERVAGKLDPTAYAKTFRHEIGHAIDDTLLLEVEDLRLNKAGWKKHASVENWIASIGGYGDIPAALQPVVRGAIEAYLQAGESPGKFIDTLRAYVRMKHPGAVEKADKSDEVSQTMATLTGMLGNNPVLASVVACEGVNNHWKFATWQVSNGRCHFLNFYYGDPVSLPSATHENLKKWKNTSAAFSDKEWFAEVYAEWYQPGGPKHAFPGFVTDFMRAKIDSLPGKGTTAKPGGGHPKLP